MQTAHSTQRFPENTWNRLFKSISDTKKLIKEHGIRNTKSDVAIRAVLSKSRLGKKVGKTKSANQ